MTKSIQDYRNIVKILKLQLLKVRQENASLSHQMGLVSESQTSSYTPKMNKYKQSDQSFAKKVMLFLEFAHRCELIGISPQMVFRITDKKRDKSVGMKNFAEVMQRLKIRMTDDEIDKMLNIISKRQKEISYERYLQCLSAFQINAEKFPFHSSRTFVQLSIIQFCKICRPLYQKPRQLFNQITQNNGIYIKFDQFDSFCSRKCNQLKETQIVAIFLGFDIQSMCKIEKEIFQRQVEKIYSLIDKGIVDNKSYVRQSPKKNKNKPKKSDSDDQQQYEEQENQGDQKLNKKKVQQKIIKEKPKEIKKSSVKLDQKTLKDIQKILSIKTCSFVDLVGKLLEKQKEKKDIYLRSFSLGDINDALKKLGDFQRKETMKIFQKIDDKRNGSISSEELIKLMIRVDPQKLSEHLPKLKALLYRHFKQTQFPNPTLKFTSLGFKAADKLTEQKLRLVFDRLNLTEDQMNFLFPILLQDGNITVQMFCAELQKDPNSFSKKQFQKMPSQVFRRLSELVNGIKAKRDNKNVSKFRKLTKVQDMKKAAGEIQTWETIFQDEWDCFEYCLKQCSKLQTFWRDPQFGPTKSDQHGLRSIVGNQSQHPSSFSDGDDIFWYSYQKMLQKRKVQQEQIFMKKDLKSTDIVQGKLGNCWYVAALSIITQNDEYIKGKGVQNLKPDDITEGICPPLFHYFIKYGMYVFKFFKKFKPIYVIVDELFPVEQSSNSLYFAYSPELNLQWVSFAEKAFAKLHHTYFNLISGDIAVGLADLINSIPIKQVLTLEEDNNIQKIKELSKQRQLMGCSIKKDKNEQSRPGAHEQPIQFEGQRCGLLAGHAYSIIDYVDLNVDAKTNFQLIRVRNPHGSSEWLLNWSDHPINDDQEYNNLKIYQQDIDKHYQKRIKQAERLGQQQPIPYKAGQDGEFLMNIQDWNKVFNQLFIGINSTYSKFKDGFMYFKKDSWGGNKQSGVCKTKGSSKQDLQNMVKDNHQYIMEIQKTTDVLMLLSQEDGRLVRGLKYPYKEVICSSIIMVFRLQENQKQLKEYDKNKMDFPNRSLVFQGRRDLNYWNVYEPGRYVVMPVRKQKSKTVNQFELRFFTNEKVQIKKLQTKETLNEQRVSEFLGKRKVNSQQKESVQKVIDFLKKNNPKFDRL